MNSFTFDCIELEPYESYQKWLRRYKGSIRTNVSWKDIKKAKVGFHIAHEATKLVFPWYEDGKGYRDGEPKIYHIGLKPVLLRVPALKLDINYLILDGCHRISEMEPRWLILDTIEAEPRYFSDCFSPFWLSKWFDKTAYKINRDQETKRKAQKES